MVYYGSLLTEPFDMDCYDGVTNDCKEQFVEVQKNADLADLIKFLIAYVMQKPNYKKCVSASGLDETAYFGSYMILPNCYRHPYIIILDHYKQWLDLCKSGGPVPSAKSYDLSFALRVGYNRFLDFNNNILYSVEETEYPGSADDAATYVYIECTKSEISDPRSEYSSAFIAEWAPACREQ